MHSALFIYRNYGNPAGPFRICAIFVYTHCAAFICGCGPVPAAPTTLRTAAGPVSRNSFEIGSLEFTSDGQAITAAGVELVGHSVGSYRLNRDGPHEYSRFGSHAHEIYAVTADVDGKLIAAGRDDGVLHFWDGTTGRLLQSVQAHSGRITSASFCRDGSAIATVGVDGALKVWKSPREGLNLTTIATGKRFTEVKLSPDGSRVAATVPRSGCFIWESIDGTPDREFNIEYPSALAFSALGDLLAVGEHGAVSVWNLKSGERIARFADDFTSIYSVAFSASGNDLIAAGRSGKVWVYDLERALLVHSFDASYRVMHVALAPDGKSAAICVGGQEVRFVDFSDSSKSGTLLKSR